MRLDPARVTTLIRGFDAVLNKQYRILQSKVVDLLVKKNAMGLTANTFWENLSEDIQIETFEEWSVPVINTTIGSNFLWDLWQKFIKSGFVAGLKRAFKDGKLKAGLQVTGARPTPTFSNEEEFTNIAMISPERNRLNVLNSRTLTEIEGLTEDMRVKLKRALMDGLAANKSPIDVGNDIVKAIGINRNRARTIARTELMRAHAEGQLVGLKQMGVDKIGVTVEWTTTKGACPQCSRLSGRTYTIDEAKGLIPAHPNCRCAWIPANVFEDILPFMKNERVSKKPTANTVTLEVINVLSMVNTLKLVGALDEDF